MTTPWTCPVCGAGVAPWVERCPCVAVGASAHSVLNEISGRDMRLDDGWIGWKGGECPVSADCHVEVKLRDGYINDVGYTAKFFGWEHAGKSTDIIAYRVVRP